MAGTLGGSAAIQSGRNAAFAPLRVPESTISFSQPKFKSFIRGNTRYNLKELTGISPERNIQAHHVLAQKFRKEFAAKGINIDDTKYLTWWGNGHQSKAGDYNAEWMKFWRNNQTATEAQILEQGKQMMREHGIKTNY